MKNRILKRHQHVFIGGGSGTGKTTLAIFFKENGKNAIDGDQYIGRWIDKKGNTVNVDYKKLGKKINTWAEKHELK